MALTIDVQPPEGGILISGSPQELSDLGEVLQEAVADGESGGTLLTDEGTETIRVVRL